MDSLKAGRRVGALPQQNGEVAAAGMQPSASAATFYSDTDGSVSKGGQTESLDSYATSEAGGSDRRSLAHRAAPAIPDGTLEEMCVEGHGPSVSSLAACMLRHQKRCIPISLICSCRPAYVQSEGLAVPGLGQPNECVRVVQGGHHGALDPLQVPAQRRRPRARVGRHQGMRIQVSQTSFWGDWCSDENSRAFSRRSRCQLLQTPSELVLPQVMVIGVKPNEVGAMWRFRLIRPWLKFWTGIFLRLGLGFWGAKVVGWDNFKKAEQDRCAAGTVVAKQRRSQWFWLYLAAVDLPQCSTERHSVCVLWKDMSMELVYESSLLICRAICIYNHVSYVDAIVMTHFFALSGVAKASVASIPYIGPIAVALQFLFVQVHLRLQPPTTTAQRILALCTFSCIQS